jgi:thiamine monophosphate kinase
LLFTTPRRLMHGIPRAFRGLPITAIGEITQGQKLLLIRRDGHEQPLISRGWDPFRRKS